jgi:hypothetical protein
MVQNQAPGFYRLMVGDFEVTALSDGTNMPLATKLLHGDPARIEEALKRNYLGDSVENSHNCFLVNTGSKLVLIDTGAGSLLGPTTRLPAKQSPRVGLSAGAGRRDLFYTFAQ